MCIYVYDHTDKKVKKLVNRHRSNANDDEEVDKCVEGCNIITSIIALWILPLGMLAFAIILVFSFVTATPVLPKCMDSIGENLNNAPCLCGSDEWPTKCSIDSGLYCYESEKSCRTIPTCSQTKGVLSNNLPCQCANANCTNTSGFYCDASINTCSHTSSCNQKNGQKLNAVSCQCGSKECTEKSGLYCKANVNVDACSIRPESKCTNTKGLVSNADNVDCKCGDVNCISSSSGKFCDVSISICRDIPYCKYSNGSTLNDGSCVCGTSTCTTTTGYVCDEKNNTCSFVECSETEGKKTNSATCLCSGKKCSPADGLYCFANSCSSRPSTVCTNIDGMTTNGEISDCKCGNANCILSGPFCDSATSVCRDVPYCRQRNGSATNNDKCQCGATKCDDTSRLHCYEASDTCAVGPPCSHTNNNIINDAPCTCGTIECTGASGLYCDIIDLAGTSFN